MTITISEENLVNIINKAIEYGGDKGGPYFYADAKAELIKLCLDEGLVLKFKQGFIHEII